MKKTYIIIIFIITGSALRAEFTFFQPIIQIDSVKHISLNNTTVYSIINLLPTDPDVTQKGIVWGKTPNPTLNNKDGFTQNGANPTMGNSLSYQSNMTELELNTTYYVRAYLTNMNSTYYGQQVVFTTIPTLGEWGLITLVFIIGIFGVYFVWRKVLV